jgi:hypothetical protein
MEIEEKGEGRAHLDDTVLPRRDRHGRPWGFFGPPVPVPEKNRTRTLGRGKFTVTGTGFSRVPVFLRVLRVTGFRVTFVSGYHKKHNVQYVFLILAICNKKQTTVIQGAFKCVYSLPRFVPTLLKCWLLHFQHI